MRQLEIYLNGAPRKLDRHFDVINPATEAVVASAPDCDDATLEAATQAATVAFPAWSADLEARRGALRRAAAAVRDHVQELGRISTSEMGKPIAHSIEEAHITAHLFEGTAALPLEPEPLADAPKAVAIVRRPHGVVAAIAPWNFPLGLSTWKVAPALLAGNTVILKPSPHTPLGSLRLGEILAEVLPPGVLTVLSGGDALGSKLVRHPAVRKIGFTGSVETGRDIAAAAGASLKRVTLELGGNDAAIILEDVDVAEVAPALFWAAFANTGQICGAIKRIYVHQARFDELVDALCDMAGKVKVGDPMDETTELGPIGNRRQLERVLSLVDEARAAGGVVHTGGERLDRPGFFMAPTVITGVAEGTRVVDEEQFGPVLPIMPVKDEEEAITRANATHYGLGASIWTADQTRAEALLPRLEAGTVWANQHFNIAQGAPFGGWKHSGIGRENGVIGLHEYTEMQVVHAP